MALAAGAVLDGTFRVGLVFRSGKAVPPPYDGAGRSGERESIAKGRQFAGPPIAPVSGLPPNPPERTATAVSRDIEGPTISGAARTAHAHNPHLELEHCST